MKNKKRIKRDVLISMMIAFSVAAAVLAFGVTRKIRGNRENSEILAAVPSTVSVASPARGDLSQTLSVSAMLEADRTVTITPLVSGPVTRIYKDEGDDVVEGEILATVDPETYDLKLKSAESAWGLADRSLKRLVKVHESSGISNQRLEEARTAQESARSDYKLAVIQREHADIRSPLTGRIITRYASVGGVASPGSPLFLISDTQSTKIVAKVPEKHWDRFSAPGSIRVVISRKSTRSNVPGHSVMGYVDKVGASISPQGRNFSVTCRPLEGVSEWPIGGLVELTFQFNILKGVAYLPVTTLSGDGSLWMIDNQQSTVRRVDAPGIYRDSRSIAVPDDWFEYMFVIEGQDRLTDGQFVKVVGRN